MHPAVGLLIAYVVGSIPAAYIAGRVVKGIDLRQHGSGNLGATNVYRLLGSKVAATVLLFDAAFLLWRYRREYRMDAMPWFARAVVVPVVALIGHLTGRYRKFADAPAPRE